MRYRIKNKKKSQYSYWERVDEMKEVEQEFAMMITGNWEEILHKPPMHNKAVRTARKLRELKTLLLTTHQIPHSIN